MTLVNINNADQFNDSYLMFATLLSMSRYIVHIFPGALHQHSCGFFKSLTCFKEHFRLSECLTCQHYDKKFVNIFDYI